MRVCARSVADRRDDGIGDSALLCFKRLKGSRLIQRMNLRDAQLNRREGRIPVLVWVIGIFLPLVIFAIFLFPPARTQHPSFPPQQAANHDMGDMQGMHHGAATQPETPEEKAKHLADKRESEFNHNLAGALLIVAALFFLAEGRLAKRWPAVRFAWPMCFLVAGLFLLLLSDTEIWPFGYQSYYYAVTHNLEVAQHKAFALILLTLGMVEAFRASGKWQAAWSAWVFPVIGLGGVRLLLFHQHGGMHGPDAIKTMERVQHQHLVFAWVGAGLALTKGLADSYAKWHALLSKVWPLLMIFLGVLLLLYKE